MSGEYEVVVVAGPMGVLRLGGAGSRGYRVLDVPGDVEPEEVLRRFRTFGSQHRDYPERREWSWAELVPAQDDAPARVIRQPRPEGAHIERSDGSVMVAGGVTERLPPLPVTMARDGDEGTVTADEAPTYQELRSAGWRPVA